MSVVYVTSDWHLGHRNIVKYRPVFESPEHMADRLFAFYTQTVSRRDVVWFIGDMIMDEKYIDEMKKLPGDKRLVMGNHDTDKFIKGMDQSRFLEAFTEIHAMVKLKHAWLTHCPMHPLSLQGKYNIHGHTHDRVVVDPHTFERDYRYVNVCVERSLYPIKLQDIIEGKAPTQQPDEE